MQRLASPYVLLTLTVLFWAGNAVVGKHITTEVTPIQLAFWRWVLATAIVLPFGLPLVWRQRALIRLHWRRLLLLSGLSVATFNTLLYLALQQSTVINVVTVNALAPAVIPLMAFLLFKDRVNRLQVTGLMLSVAGALVVIARGDIQVLAGLAFNPGDLLAVVALLDWALYTVLVQRRTDGLRSLTFLTVTFIAGLILLTPFYVADLASAGGFEPDISNLMAILYVALFPSIAAYVCWNRAVGEVGATVAGQFLNLVPVFAAILAVLFLGEVIHLYHWIGLALVFAGIALVARGRRLPGAPV
ncbi:MAG: DMT family transporter [Magnetovibrionaceae bacterium]